MQRDNINFKTEKLERKWQSVKISGCTNFRHFPIITLLRDENIHGI